MKTARSPLASTVPPTQSSAPNLSWWGATADAWDTAGMDPAVTAHVRTIEARMATANQERSTALERSKASQRELRIAVARGEITYDKAARELAQLTAVEALAEASSQRRIGQTLAADLTVTLRAIGDDLIVEHLAPAYALVVSEAAVLAPDVAEIAEDAQAMRAAPAARDAWSRLITLEARHRDLQRLAQRLRHAHVTTVSPGAFDVEYQYRHPDRITKPTGGVLGFIAAIADNAEPYIGTARDVDALEAARPESLRIATPKAAPIVRRDGSLIGGSAA